MTEQETEQESVAAGHAGRSNSSGASALELLGVRKVFGDVVAVNDVALSFRRGEVHALLGENGAGKTTLMNIVAGYVAPDAGEILLDGEAVVFRSPRDAMSAGVGMVHQHFRLIEQLTVAENLAIGAHDVGALVDRRSLVKRAEDIAERFGLGISANKLLWRLSVGEKQRVEILRTLDRGARLLVLDEPTAVLTPSESDALCRTLRRIAAEDSTTIIFISHKLNEVLGVADRITVMRAGAIVDTLQRAECDISVLARLMVGETRRSEMFHAESGTPQAGNPVLQVGGVSVYNEHGLLALDDVSFAVSGGEILGVAGVAGNGQQELEEVLTGMRSPDNGTVIINDMDLAGSSARAFIDAGVAYIPDDRKGVGLLPTEPIWRNAIMKSYRYPPVRRGPLVSSGEGRRYADNLVKRVNLSTDNIDTPVQHLSGGNAQKLLVGRELDGDPQLVVAVNPTQGLDIGAVDAVWRQLVAARDRGLAVLLVSADLDEVLRLSDRVLVLYEGRIVGHHLRNQVDRQRVGLLMGGGGREMANA